MATTTEETYTVGTLVVDLFDSRTRKLIWRGKATDILPEDPKKTTKKLNKDIEKLFWEISSEVIAPHHFSRSRACCGLK